MEGAVVVVEVGVGEREEEAVVVRVVAGEAAQEAVVEVVRVEGAAFRLIRQLHSHQIDLPDSNELAP